MGGSRYDVGGCQVIFGASTNLRGPATLCSVSCSPVVIYCSDFQHDGSRHPKAAPKLEKIAAMVSRRWAYISNERLLESVADWFCCYEVPTRTYVFDTNDTFAQEPTAESNAAWDALMPRKST